MTPCEELGYKVGDRFIVIKDYANYFKPNETVYLVKDDASTAPMFSKIKDNTDLRNVKEFTTGYLELSEVTKIENNAHSINTKLRKLLSSPDTLHPSLEDTFTAFINSLGADHDAELSIKKDKYTLYFDNYEFDGDEARIRKVIEMLTELHVKGEWFGKSNLTPKEVSEASYRVANVMMEARSKS